MWTPSRLAKSALILFVAATLVMLFVSTTRKAAAEPDNVVREYRELTGQTFYIDPGHGDPANADSNGYCYTTGTSGLRESYERDWTLQIGLRLRDILMSHGATVHISRTATDPSNPCNGARAAQNNALRGQNQNWRLISIHLNCCLNTSTASANRVEVYYREYDANGAPTPAGRDLAQKALRRLEMVVPSSGNFTGPLVNQVLRESQPTGDNILTESGHLTYAPFENRLMDDPNYVQQLAYAHYRAVVDFWLVGYKGPHQNPSQEVIDTYWNNINAGRDPGVPFSNGGGGYYLHQWGNAWTQEFAGGHGPFGSILQSIYGGGANYVRNPIWNEYIQKNGPNSNGPGLPRGPEHPWNIGRGVRGQSFYYPQVVNFERGAITYNSDEGAVFLPNCYAAGIAGHWAQYWAERMVSRFAISNDLDGPNPYGQTRFNDNGVHPDDVATRAQVAQTLMLAEGYPYDPRWQSFNDIGGHWANLWIRMVGSRGIVGGYTDGTFRPDVNTTRDQFSKMLVLSRGWDINLAGAPHFTDVPPGSTFYVYVETAYNRGVMSGYADGTFRPGEALTRGQLIKMVDNSLPPPPGGCWVDL